MDTAIDIRRATPDDAASIADVWLASWRATFDFEPSHRDDDVRRWMATVLMPGSECWVAAEPAGRVVGILALSDTMIEQLYLTPDWIGRGLGCQFMAVAKARRPVGLDLYCFQVNARARRFYEGQGFAAVGFGDGSGNEEHQPDVHYAWRPVTPDRVVTSADGTPIAVFSTGVGPPLVLVHGTSADHTTFRVIGPRLAERFTVHAIDRRGRGASGDTTPYSIEREFEDVAAVASSIAAAGGGPVDVVGHSYGGRCALGAALLTADIGRVVCYEGAPTPPGVRYGDAGLTAELAALADRGANDELLATFLTRVVGMDEADLAAYRANPVWAARVAAAPTIVREIRDEGSSAAGLDRLGRVRQPVLQLLGGSSRSAFGAATRALDERLANSAVVVIAGARHAAHHTHPGAVVEALTAFLFDPRGEIYGIVRR